MRDAEKGHPPTSLAITAGSLKLTILMVKTKEWKGIVDKKSGVGKKHFP